MILFLNKCDLLKRKLQNGAMVRNFLPSYGDRPNDPQVVVKCEFHSTNRSGEDLAHTRCALLDLKQKFKDILQQYSPEPRVSYYYATSVTVCTLFSLCLPHLK